MDEVRAELEWPLAVGAGEGVVDRHQDVALVGDLGRRGDVDQLEQRVGRTFEPDEPRASFQCSGDVFSARSIDKRET